MSAAEGSLAVLRELYRYCARLSEDCEAKAKAAHRYDRGRDVPWYQGQAAGARVVQREIERLAVVLKASVEGGIHVNRDNRRRSPDRNGPPGAINS